MASVFVGFNRGVEGFKQADFTVGATTGGTDMELRYDQTKSLTRKDLVLFLCAMTRWVASQFFISTNTPDL